MLAYLCKNANLVVEFFTTKSNPFTIYICYPRSHRKASHSGEEQGIKRKLLSEIWASKGFLLLALLLSPFCGLSLYHSAFSKNTPIYLHMCGHVCGCVVIGHPTGLCSVLPPWSSLGQTQVSDLPLLSEPSPQALANILMLGTRVHSLGLFPQSPGIFLGTEYHLHVMSPHPPKSLPSESCYSTCYPRLSVYEHLLP